MDTGAEAALSLELSHEELLYLIAVLRLPGFPGVDNQEVQAFSAPEKTHLALAARHSLQARDLMVVALEPEPSITLDESAAALLMNYASAQRALAMLSFPADGPPRRALFSMSDLLIIEHTDPRPGVHTFTAYPDMKALLSHLLAVIGVQAQPAPDTPWHITIQTRWLRIHQDAVRSEGAEAGIPALAAAGAPPEQAELLHNVLWHMTAMHTFMGVKAAAGAESSGSGFSIIQSAEDTLWMVSAEDKESAQIDQIGAAQMTKSLIGLLQTVVSA